MTKTKKSVRINMNERDLIFKQTLELELYIYIFYGFEVEVSIDYGKNVNYIVGV